MAVRKSDARVDSSQPLADSGLGPVELQTLLLTGQAMSQETDRERICAWACDAAAAMCGARLAAVTLAEPRGEPFVRGKLGGGELPSDLAAHLARAAGDHALRSAQPSHPVAGDSRDGLERWGVQRVTKVELATVQRSFGAFIAGYASAPSRPGRDEFILKTLANQAALALDNDRLRRQSQNQADRLASLNRIVQATISSPDLRSVFRVLSTEIGKLLPHDRLSLGLVEPGQQTAVLYAIAGEEGDLGAGSRVPLAHSLIGQTVRERRATFRKDLELAEDFVEKEFLLPLGLRAVLLAPLQHAGQCFGTLNLASQTVGEYEEEHLPVAQEIADQIAVAVMNSRLYRDTQRLADHMSTIGAIGARVSSILSLDDLLPQVTGLVRDTFGFYSVSIFLGSPDSGYLVLRATSAEPGAGLAAGHRIPVSETSIVGWVFSHGEPVVANDVSKDERYLPMAALPAVEAELAVPISLGGEVVGVLDVQSRNADPFDDIHKATMRTLAGQLAVALENARLFGETRDMAILDERNRMAREIHDTLAQGLTGIVLQLEAADRALERRPDQVAQHLAEAKAHARDCLREARRSVWSLVPALLEERTLAQALQLEVDRFSAMDREAVTYTTSGDEMRIPRDAQAALLRISQESLTNVRRHAAAANVSVHLSLRPDSVELEVQDDGRGFDVDAALGRTQAGFGLRGMRDRARQFGGELVVESGPRGTTVRASIPTFPSGEALS